MRPRNEFAVKNPRERSNSSSSRRRVCVSAFTKICSNHPLAFPVHKKQLKAWNMLLANRPHRKERNASRTINLCCLGKFPLTPLSPPPPMGISQFSSTFFRKRLQVGRRRTAKSLDLYLTTQQLEASNLKII